MYKILLCCTSSLTTSLLVDSMKQEAKNRGIDILCWAVAENAVELSWAEADCILVAPQARSELEKLNQITRHTIPCAAIDKADFSKMNGNAVLNQAIHLIENYIA